MNKGNISQSELSRKFHFISTISQVSSVRLFKMFSGFRMFLFLFSHHSGAAGDKRRRKIRTKTEKKNVDHTNNFKLTEKKKLSIHYFIINEASHANYSECIMNFIHHMSNELACLTQQEGQGNLC